jgi:hypothetical protein
MAQEQEDQSQQPESEVETRTLFDAVTDRQEVLSQLRDAIGEAGQYFSARVSRILWSGCERAELEIEDLLCEIDQVNKLLK